ncbi:MAG: type II toxin-antitoxin system RelE/ParE family toxin [Planctomycetota bacterium]|nr:type II toxin-antitoxin system RelE/ParE family toxin [Planctomycetota bacterium]MDA1248269.1 type II toxin-antitoxin system RelE/ParE family toxin [Planctomycetota bacterium]
MDDAPDVIFDQQAAAEYRDVRRWYSREASPDLADDFRAEVDRGVEMIARNPARCGFYDSEQQHRWIRLRRFPYLLIYSVIDEQTVLIVAVAHVRRSPGYWKDR